MSKKYLKPIGFGVGIALLAEFAGLKINQIQWWSFVLVFQVAFWTVMFISKEQDMNKESRKRPPLIEVSSSKIP